MKAGNAKAGNAKVGNARDAPRETGTPREATEGEEETREVGAARLQGEKNLHEEEAAERTELRRAEATANPPAG